MTSVPLLEQIHAKPEATRRKLFYVLLTMGMLFFVSLWLVNLQSTVAADKEEKQHGGESLSTSMKLFFLEAKALGERAWAELPK